MKVHDFTANGSHEKNILIGMITSSIVLGRISNSWDGRNLFTSKYAQLLGELCVEYYKKYTKAPGKQIEGLFKAWAEKQQDEGTVKMVEKFLGEMDGDYRRKGSNPDYILDVAGEYFNKVRLTQLSEMIQGYIDAGDLDKATESVTNFSKVQIGATGYIDLLSDDEAVNACFSKEESEVLIQHPGALGEFYRDTFSRDAFVSFFGPEKVGKSFYLIDTAALGVLQRRKVAFFATGDMSARQVNKRFYSRFAKWPAKSSDGKWPATIKYPISISHTSKRDQEDEDDPNWRVAKVDFEERIFDKPLNKEIADKARERVKKKLRSDDPFLRISCHPAGTINVAGIRSTIQNWEREGFVPDVIVIDYADILAPPVRSQHMLPRDQINLTWQQLRSLSTEYHACVVTATQSDAKSYTTRLLSRDNFSEDKRKLSHVTAMVGLNVTPEEKERGVYRLNHIALREDDYSVRRVVHVASCLALALPCVCSCWSK